MATRFIRLKWNYPSLDHLSWLRVDFASAFNKITAYLGLATGILGIVSLTGLTLTIIMNAIFATVWILVVGYGLCRLAQEQSPELRFRRFGVLS